MALAVAMNSRRRVSIEEKEASRPRWRVAGMVVVSVERVEKKKWLLCAMEAWLKREAIDGWRAYLMRRFFVELE